MIDSEGYLHVPAAPGLGAEIDFDAVKKYTV
jgi:L-alanine-DL-glutamate epimerase-like enolase superfamily enzyme